MRYKVAFKEELYNYFIAVWSGLYKTSCCAACAAVQINAIDCSYLQLCVKERFCPGSPTLHFERRAVTVGLFVPYWRLAMAFWGDAVIVLEAGQKGHQTNALLQAG